MRLRISSNEKRLERNKERVMNNLLKTKEDINGEKRFKRIKKNLKRSDEI